MGRRLRQQRLSGKQFSTPAEAVAWLGAAQAQDFHGAKWAIGLRVRESNDGIIERAFGEGRILRTHVMRPTWHFVTPEDIRWLLELTAPRVHSANSHVYRQVGLGESLSSRSKG